MKRTAVVCGGQGAQFVGMGKALHDQNEVARAVFAQADAVLGFKLSELCFDGNKDELTSTANAQPAILTLSYAQARVYFDELAIYPRVFAGHSLGEFTALTLAGAMQFSDALAIVRRRGQLMQAAVQVPSGMAAISGTTKEQVEAAVASANVPGEEVVISNVNSSRQFVISGHLGAVDRAVAALEGNGAKVSRLNVSAPFHSPYMADAAEGLRQELERHTYNEPSAPVIANCSATPYRGRSTIVDNLTRQLYSPVQWKQTMDYLQSLQIDSVIEVGPKQVLSNLMRSEKPSIRAFALDVEADRDEWLEFRKPELGEVNLLGRCLAIAVCTRNRNFDDDSYQAGVVVPYNKIKAMQETLEEAGRHPSQDEMLQALTLLKTILETKQTPTAEQEQRFSQILKETGLYGDLWDQVRTAALV